MTEWIDIDFGHERAMHQASIRTSGHWQSVKEFELQRRVNGKWETFYRQEKPEIDTTLIAQFDSITIRQVRLKVTMTKATTLQTRELQFSGPDETKE